MSSLSVYHESSPELPNKVLNHLEDIVGTLAALRVHFARWQATAPLTAGASEQEMIAAFRPQLDALMGEGGYRTCELISHSDGQTQQAETRILQPIERREAEDQAHFLVLGRGLYCLHIDEYVYAVLCEKGDLLGIPAGTRHWVDMGERPHFIGIQLRGDAQGIAAGASGNDIASRFPRLDDWS
ncbi:acireductone dioxygenase [Pseudomonas zhanjiangensis]|uniref:Acireductone dioxygenase n=1 Tax=Pseudomonas zhanjiangensis TaxID=3239015 RepID=A0ABV3YVE3_9PSED